MIILPLELGLIDSLYPMIKPKYRKDGITIPLKTALSNDSRE
jgi:hypothetical protein